MATLYDYVASLDIDGTPVVWSYKPLQKSEIDSAAGNPYLYIRELDERPVVRIYGNIQVIQAYVDVQIFQAPTDTGRMPNRDKAMQLYFDLYDAFDNVDEWIYGQKLVGIHHDFAMPPQYDEDSGGLTGIIRYRLLFPRGS